MGGRSIAVEPHPASESLGIATSAEDSEERCPVEKAAETERQRANSSPLVDRFPKVASLFWGALGALGWTCGALLLDFAT